jgi:uncharacterized membrane protein YheB (UPF0754 family)
MALKLLFHPHEPKRFLGLTIQGVFPKRKRQIAESLGKIVGQELLSFQEIERTITHPDNVNKILPLVDQHIDYFLHHKLKDALPIISLFIGERTLQQLKSVFMQELEELFPVIMKNYVGNMKNDLDLERIITEKIVNFSAERLEQMLNQILTREFRFVEVIGAGLGFFIGVLQILLTLIIK